MDTNGDSVDDFKDGLTVGKELEKRFMPKTRSRKAIDMARRRLDKAYEQLEISRGQWRALGNMLDDMEGRLEEISRGQKKAKKEAFKQVATGIEELKKLLDRGDPRPYKTFTLQSIVEHLKRVAHDRAEKGQKADWLQEIDWESMAQLCKDAYSVDPNTGQAEDGRLECVMKQLEGLGWGKIATEWTEREVELGEEQFREQMVAYLSSTDGIAKALDQYRGGDPLEDWHIKLIVERLTDEIEGEDIKEKLRTGTFYNGGGDRKLKDTAGALDLFMSEYEGLINVAEGRVEARQKAERIARAEAEERARAEAERKAKATPERWGKLTPDEERFSDIVERAVDNAMKGVERRLDRLESEVKATTEQLQKAVEKLKERGVARLPTPKRTTKQPQFMMPKHFEVVQGEVKMTQSPFMETCWSCNEEMFNVWSMDVQKAFEDMPSFPKGRAARYYWHTCEKCKRDNKTGWNWVEMPTIEHFTYNAMIDPGFYNRVDEHLIPRNWIVEAIMEVWLERRGGMISTAEIMQYLGWSEDRGYGEL